jgi:hypothetical protein
MQCESKILVCKLEVESAELHKNYPYKVYINYVFDFNNKKLCKNIMPNERNCWKVCDGIYYSIDYYNYNCPDEIIMMDSETNSLIIKYLNLNLNRNFTPNKTYILNCPLCNSFLNYNKTATSMIISKEFDGLQQNNNYVTICQYCYDSNINKLSELFRFKMMNKSIKPHLPKGFTFYFM